MRDSHTLKKPMSAKNTPPQLRLFTFEWNAKNFSGIKNITTLDALKLIKKNGFHAVGVWPNAEVLTGTIELGLERVSYVDANETTYVESLQKTLQMKPSRVNVQLWDHDTPPSVAVKTWLKMEPLAEKLGLNVDLEVHRDTCTETPEKTYEIAALYKKATGRDIRMCFDFSHFAIVKHIGTPYAARLLTHPHLIQKARQLHFRSFNGHHCQVPVLDAKGQMTPEIKDYLAFVDELIKCWLKGQKGGEILYVNPELLPGPGYGLSTFQNLWKETLVLKDEIVRLWNKNIRQWKPAR